VCTTKDVGYSVKVEAKHLKPSKWYSYRFSAVNGDKATSPEGRFKTLPRPNDDIASVNFAVFSCSNLPVGSFAAYGNAAKHKEIDYALHVG
jgi:alkaline phosphatase D